MRLLITPSEDDVYECVKAFLAGILPNGGAAFKATIKGSTLDVTEMLTDGSIALYDAVLGDLVKPGTQIAALGTGSGGIGKYTVSPSQAADYDMPSQTMSTGVEIVQAQTNRVPPPVGSDYVVMNATRNAWLATNLDTYADAAFTGSIAGTVLTVSDATLGEVIVGATVFGEGVQPGTTVRGQTAPGVYSVSPSQTVAETQMAAGGKTVEQEAQFTIQLDVHGPNGSDNAQLVSTMFRDQTAYDAFTAFNPAIAPLYCSNPRQVPFSDGEQQYEDRWIVELEIQVDQTVRVAQQFAETLGVEVISVEERYPPNQGQD